MNTNNTSDSDETKKQKKDKSRSGGNDGVIPEYHFYNGTFLQFGRPERHDQTERGIRAIQWAKNYTELWIANEDYNAIIVVDRDGEYVHHIDIPRPIGLFYHLPEAFHHPSDTAETTTTLNTSENPRDEADDGKASNKSSMKSSRKVPNDDFSDDDPKVAATAPLPLIPETTFIADPDTPIHEEHIMFIGSKDKLRGGVHAIDVETYAIVKSYQTIGLIHPTGITAYKDVLFVADQSMNGVVTFNMTTMRIIKMIIPSQRLFGQVEHIALSEC